MGGVERDKEVSDFRVKRLGKKVPNGPLVVECEHCNWSATYRGKWDRKCPILPITQCRSAASAHARSIHLIDHPQLHVEELPATPRS